GGNRRGRSRRYINLMITMLLGGLWHGAGWTFVVWGGLHGFYLIVNHAWQNVCQKILGWSPERPSSILGRAAAGTLTFAAVLIGWVIFRSDDLATALRMMLAMSGHYGVIIPASVATNLSGAASTSITPSGVPNLMPTLIAEAAVLPIVWLAPNTQQIMAEYRPAFENIAVGPARWLSWRPSTVWCVIVGLYLGYSLLTLSRVSDFIYF